MDDKSFRVACWGLFIFFVIMSCFYFREYLKIRKMDAYIETQLLERIKGRN